MNAVPLAELARRETIALHEFFVAWFRDTAGAVDFSPCERSLAPDFRMVAPDGSVRDCARVLAGIRQARGNAPAGFGITILEPVALWQEGDAVLLQYIEHQYGGGRETRRRSSALLTRAPAARHGVVWRYLQETWMAEEKNV